MDTAQQTEFEEALELINKIVVKNTNIVTPESLGQSEFFHIATAKFKELVPNVSKRAAPSEDNTLPRIHVAPTLMGCLNGYAVVTNDIVNSNYGKKSDYPGGYYLYFIPFEFALAPSEKLVYDAEVTDEHWLITYNKETRTYKPSAVGRIVNVAVTFLPSAIKKGAEELITLAVEIPENAKLHLEKDNWIYAGYHTVDIKRDNSRDLFTVHKTSKIDKAQFNKYVAEKTERFSVESRHVLKDW